MNSFDTVSLYTARGISKDSKVLELAPGEWKWVIRFVNLLRSGPIAARAIKWNLLMVLKGAGLFNDAEDRLLPRPSADEDTETRKEIELAERLIAGTEEDRVRDKPRSKRSGGTKG